MKQLVALPLLVACSMATAAIVDMPFSDAAGTQYSTGNYQAEIQKRLPGTQPLLFLVVTTGVDEPEFTKQMAVFEKLDGEELQLLVVVGSATSVDKHSYWLAGRRRSLHCHGHRKQRRRVLFEYAGLEAAADSGF